MKNLSLFLLALILVSCGSYKQSNFQRQKFTDLKSQKVYTSNPEIDSFSQLAKKSDQPLKHETQFELTDVNTKPSDQTDFTFHDYDESTRSITEFTNTPQIFSTDDTMLCDTIYLKNGDILICRIQNVTTREISFNYCNDIDKSYVLSRDQIQTFSGEKINVVETEEITLPEKKEVSYQEKKERVIGTRRDFEKLSEHDQNQAILDHNRLFNIGVILFFAALLFLVAGLFLIEAFFVAGALLVALWIFSFIALKKVRRIDLSDQPESLTKKVRLWRVVCGIGVAVCIVSLSAWIILLILWLTRVI